MALIMVPSGEVACVVTSLEMRTRPLPRPLPASQLRLVSWARPTTAKYRQLFARIGTPWLWYSRLAMDDGELLDIIHDPNIAIHAVIDRSGIEIGMLELDYRRAGQCEIAFLGLVPELAGKGHGRWLMANALMLAWRRDVTRVWVHTCTLDHPAALGFYRAQGFVPFARSLETFPDPRLTGLLPRDAAPQIPMLGEP